MPGKQNSKSTLDFLGGVGTDDRGDSLSLDHSAQVLIDMSEYLISFAQAALRRDGSDATGDLEESLSISNPHRDGDKISIDVLILDRYKFVDEGVNGTRQSNGSPYSFKYEIGHGGKSGKKSKFIEAIKAWIKIRGGRALKYAPIRGRGRKTEQKDKKLSVQESEINSYAFAIATKIKQKGIKPTHFFSKAVKATERKFKEELAKGFKIDIIESFKED